MKNILAFIALFFIVVICGNLEEVEHQEELEKKERHYGHFRGNK